MPLHKGPSIKSASWPSGIAEITKSERVINRLQKETPGCFEQRACFMLGWRMRSAWILVMQEPGPSANLEDGGAGDEGEGVLAVPGMPDQDALPERRGALVRGIHGAADLATGGRTAPSMRQPPCQLAVPQGSPHPWKLP